MPVRCRLQLCRSGGDGLRRGPVAVLAVLRAAAGWYSLEDTKTPFYLTVVYNVLMVGVSLPLFYWAAVEFKVTALALGYSVAYWFTFGLAWMVLNRRLGHLQARQTAWVLGRLLIAGAVAGVVGFGVNLAFTAFVSNLQDEVASGIRGDARVGSGGDATHVLGCGPGLRRGGSAAQGPRDLAGLVPGV